jgi:heme exporter protein D
MMFGFFAGGGAAAFLWASAEAGTAAAIAAAMVPLKNVRRLCEFSDIPYSYQ